jgi:hypothetical protein
MDYARNVLGLPVPKVLDRSARAEDLRSEALDLISQVCTMERSFVSRRFSQIGSLDYKEDVEPVQARPLYAEGAYDGGAFARFRVGPYTEWDVWRGTRVYVEADRGPCKFVLAEMQR